ncbi:hypothetical protein LT493_12325 [Streptomyces tricolor]|nr:hypothetical protein [Streptomyces tricolor]
MIADSFVRVHEEWGTADKVTVIPNWAPLDEIVPVSRGNAWSAEHGLDGVRTVLYSGTLGLKHNLVLLVRLAERLREQGQPGTARRRQRRSRRTCPQGRRRGAGRRADPAALPAL